MEPFSVWKVKAQRHIIKSFESVGVDDLLRQMRIFAEQIAPQFAE